MMDRRRCPLFLLVLIISWTYADCRSMRSFNSMVAYKTTSDGGQRYEGAKKNDKLCELCENFTSEAAYFLAENKTQDEIIGSLHKACTKLGSYEQECIILVDYYASVFFKVVSSIRPEDFCREIDLCMKRKAVSSLKNDDSRNFCRQDVEVLIKLRDPDTEVNC